MPKKIVINRCYGGFSLSEAAVSWLAFRKVAVTCHGYIPNSNKELPRDHPKLVECIEALGDRANGVFADLAIVAIPSRVKWTIEDYDGKEQVAEAHRTWP